MTNTDTPTGPIEVWLTQRNLVVTCKVVHEDERIDRYDIESLSMRGAQREITGALIADGFKPEGRWAVESEDEHGDINNGASETWRRFQKGKASS